MTFLPDGAERDGHRPWSHPAEELLVQVRDVLDHAVDGYRSGPRAALRGPLTFRVGVLREPEPRLGADDQPDGLCPSGSTDQGRDSDRVPGA